MNAIYYECVNEKQKKVLKVGELEPTTLCLLFHCSNIFTITFSYYIQTNFSIRSKPCPV
jgi:hypothetical protein